MAIDGKDMGVLWEVQPAFVIVYNPDISFVRQLEVTTSTLIIPELVRTVRMAAEKIFISAVSQEVLKSWMAPSSARQLSNQLTSIESAAHSTDLLLAATQNAHACRCTKLRSQELLCTCTISGILGAWSLTGILQSCNGSRRSLKT